MIEAEDFLLNTIKKNNDRSTQQLADAWREQESV